MGAQPCGAAGSRGLGCCWSACVRGLLREALRQPLWGRHEEVRSQEGNGPVLRACKAWQCALLPCAPPEKASPLPAPRPRRAPRGLEDEEALE